MLIVPFRAWWFWRGMRGNLVAPELPDSRYYTFRDAWGLAVGLAHCKMKWYFTSEEAFGRLRDRRKSEQPSP